MSTESTESTDTPTINRGLDGVVADVTAVSRVVPEQSYLSYRGYDVNALAEQLPFTAVALLLWHGELPTVDEHRAFCQREATARSLPDGLLRVLATFPRDAHPMDVMRTGISWLGTTDPEADALDQASLQRIAERLFAAAPTLLAAFRRTRMGQPIIPPDSSRDYVSNFFHMCGFPEPDATTRRCFDVSMTLYAEHGFNVSTFTARAVLSSLADAYGAVTAAIASLKGPLHGGANEAVQRMVETIGAPEHALAWIKEAIAAKRKIMGFGHRIYRTGDSRVPMMTRALKELAASRDAQHGNGDGAKIIAMLAILNEHMVTAKGIHPNLDFPSGPAYHLMGIETDLFTPIFVMSRITGWTAHLKEQAAANRLVRPSTHYVGADERRLPAGHGLERTL